LRLLLGILLDFLHFAGLGALGRRDVGVLNGLLAALDFLAGPLLALILDADLLLPLLLLESLVEIPEEHTEDQEPYHGPNDVGFVHSEV